MPRETIGEKMRRANAIIDRLDARMPEAKIELDYRSPLELLVAVALAAQTTDKRVNLVSPDLFRDFPTAAHYAEATVAKLRPYLKTIGLFRNKSRNLIRLGQQLVRRFGGEVPIGRVDLETLPGVGPKTAGVVSMHLGGDDAFPVDTHVFRLAYRMGFAPARTPDATEVAMRRLLPPTRWFKGHQLLVWHGRRVCHARKPECARCTVEGLCPKRGV